MNLIVSPSSGIISQTIFTISLLPNYISQNENVKYYYKYKYKGIEKTVNIQNSGSNNGLQFNISFDSSEQISNPVTIKVYADIINLSGNQETLENEILLFTSKNNLDFNKLIESILNSYDNINNLTNQDKNNLVKILNDLNSFNEIIKIKNEDLYSKPIMKENGLLIYEEDLCPENFCNNNGECVLIETTNYCYCYDGFGGKRCQFNERNYHLLKNYFKNFKNILISQNLNENMNQSIISLHDHIESTKSFLEEIDDLNKYVLLLENLIKTNFREEKSDDLNSSLILSIINNLLSMTEQNIIKTKIDNYESKLNKKLVVSYKKSNNKQPQNPYSSHNHNSTRHRKLEQSNNTKINISASEFYLLDDQLSKFNLEIQNITNSIIQLTNKVLKNQYENETLKISNSNFDILAKLINLDDLIEFKKEKIFIERMIEKKSYFDLEFYSKKYGKIGNSTIKEIKNELKVRMLEISKHNNIDLEKCTGKINMIYIYNKNPIFNLKYSIANNSITSSHLIEFFDCDFNKIELSKIIDQEDKFEITHYLPIISKNKNFIDNYNLNPENYLKLKNEFSEYYLPLFIFPNGTIDKTPNEDYQINKYNTKYIIRLVNSYDVSFAKSITNSGYLIAQSKETGEFFTSIEKKKPNKKANNLYFLNYPEIFLDANNYIYNRCFYVLILILVGNLILLVFTLFFKKVLNRGMLDVKEIFAKEKINLLNDETIFRQYFKSSIKTKDIIFRYECSGISLDKNILSNSSKNFTEVNNSGGKIFEASKINLSNNAKIDNNISQQVEIELHVSSQLENTKPKELNSEKNNYRVIKNIGNLNCSSIDNSEKDKCKEYKKNEEEVKIQNADNKNINNFNKSATHRNNTIKQIREHKNIVSVEEIDKELGINVINNNEDSKRCFTGKFRAFIFFILKRNLYCNFILNVSAFNPKYKYITKIFTLIYLLSGFSALFIGFSDIDFRVFYFFLIF